MDSFEKNNTINININQKIPKKTPFFLVLFLEHALRETHMIPAGDQVPTDTVLATHALTMPKVDLW